MGKSGTKKGQLILSCVIILNNNDKEISVISPLPDTDWGAVYAIT